MILVFGGLGFLALLLPLLGGFLGGLLGQAVAPGRADSFTALGVALAGIAVYLLGRRLNGNGDERAAAYREHRGAELHHLVENGAFMGLPGGARPTSLAQARAEAAQLLDAETEQVRRSSSNRHSIFFVPMHWAGPLIVVGGIVAALAAAR